jgi:hypothetical protein
MITWLVFAFIMLAILAQPSPKRRQRGRRRHHHYHSRAVQPAPAVPAAAQPEPVASAVPRKRRKSTPAASAEASKPVSAEDPTRGDVFSALKNMGFSAKDAKAAVQLCTSATGFESILKESLNMLRKPDAKVLAG